jgi:predicted DNA-binding transcriptional regulator YafY
MKPRHARSNVPLSEGSLEAWKAVSREPVFFSDAPHEWRFIEAMWLQEPVLFHYWGGNSPGALRRIVPRRVFRVGTFRGLYFAGWCALRGEERVFRMDRAQLSPPEQGLGIEDRRAE